MDSIRVSEAPDPGSIPGEATKKGLQNANLFYFQAALFALSQFTLCDLFM